MLFNTALRALDVAEAAYYFEHFAARGEHAAAGALVLVERVHEFDFVVGVVALAGGGVDLAAATDFHAPLQVAPLDGDGYGLDATVAGLATFNGPVATVDGNLSCILLEFRHGRHLRNVSQGSPGHRKSPGGKWYENGNRRGPSIK